MLLLPLSALSAKKYIVTCALQGSCPVTVNIDGVQHVLTKADEYATSPPNAVVVYIDGRIEWSAYDKDGNRITQCSQTPVRDDKGNVIYVRMILGGAGYTYRKNDSSSSYDSGYGGSSSSDSSGYADSGSAREYSHMSAGDYAKSKSIETVVSTAGKFRQSVIDIIDVESRYYPYLAANVGVSRFGGQYVRIKTCLGGAGGFTLLGGVGKEWIFSRRNDESLMWHCGIGYYMADDAGSEFGLNILFGETPVCPGKGLLLELSYGYFFGYSQRFGIYGTLGIGGGSFNAKKKKFIFDYGIGVAVKMWSK